MEYINPERRTTRKDLKRKERFNKYKKGGSNRINHGRPKEEMMNNNISKSIICVNPRCKKEFITHKKIKYCSEECRLRYHSLIRYNKFKNDEGRKKKAKEFSKEYYEKNREEIKAKMRKNAKKYYIKKKIEKDKQKNENSN